MRVYPSRVSSSNLYKNNNMDTCSLRDILLHPRKLMYTKWTIALLWVSQTRQFFLGKHLVSKTLSAHLLAGKSRWNLSIFKGFSSRKSEILKGSLKMQTNLAVVICGQANSLRRNHPDCGLMIGIKRKSTHSRREAFYVVMESKGILRNHHSSRKPREVRAELLFIRQ